MKSPLASLQAQTSQPAQAPLGQVPSSQTQVRTVITQSPPIPQISPLQTQPQVLPQLQVQLPQGQATTTTQPPAVQSSFPFQQQPMLSQAPSAALQPSQSSFPYQQNIQIHQQLSPRSTMIQSHSLSMSSSTPIQHPQSHPPQPMQPPTPPLPQQPRPLGPSSQPQHQHSQGMGFHPTQGPPYHPQLPYQAWHIYSS